MDKKYLDILPVDEMFESDQEGPLPGIVPVMSMPFNLISKIKKDNNSSVLFLMNQDNPHIINAIFSGEQLETEVGRIKNININLDSEELEVTISISDKKFQKKIIRDLSAAGKIKFDGDKIIFIGDDDGSI